MVSLCLPLAQELFAHKTSVGRDFWVVLHVAAEGQVVSIQNAHIPASVFLLIT